MLPKIRCFFICFMLLFATVFVGCKDNEKPEKIIVPLEDALPQKEMIVDKDGADLLRCIAQFAT